LTHQFAAARNFDSLTIVGPHHNIAASHRHKHGHRHTDTDTDTDTHTDTGTLTFNMVQGARSALLYASQWRPARVAVECLERK